MKRRFVCLLLICFSLSILGLAFHHHADGVPHDNCSICSYVSHHSNLVIQDFPQISLLSSNALFISIENTAEQLIPVLSSLFKSSPSCIREPFRVYGTMSSSLFVLLMDA